MSRNTITFLLTPIAKLLSTLATMPCVATVHTSSTVVSVSEFVSVHRLHRVFSAESFLVIVSSSLTVINPQRMVLNQGRRHQSGWSGFNLTTFQIKSMYRRKRDHRCTRLFVSLFQQRQENCCSFSVSSVRSP